LQNRNAGASRDFRPSTSKSDYFTATKGRERAVLSLSDHTGGHLSIVSADTDRKHSQEHRVLTGSSSVCVFVRGRVKWWEIEKIRRDIFLNLITRQFICFRAALHFFPARNHKKREERYREQKKIISLFRAAFIMPQNQ
jgi:hypothetical protein